MIAADSVWQYFGQYFGSIVLFQYAVKILKFQFWNREKNFLGNPRMIKSSRLFFNEKSDSIVYFIWPGTDDKIETARRRMVFKIPPSFLFVYSRSSLSGRSRKRTALLMAALTKSRLNSSPYKLCIYTFRRKWPAPVADTQFLLPEGVRLRELRRYFIKTPPYLPLKLLSFPEVPRWKY